MYMYILHDASTHAERKLTHAPHDTTHTQRQRQPSSQPAHSCPCFLFDFILISLPPSRLRRVAIARFMSKGRPAFSPSAARHLPTVSSAASSSSLLFFLFLHKYKHMNYLRTTCKHTHFSGCQRANNDDINTHAPALK